MAEIDSDELDFWTDRTLIAEVNRLAVEGETFVDAGCMVVSWLIVNVLLEECGTKEDLEFAIQRILRLVFVHTGEPVH